MNNKNSLIVIAAVIVLLVMNSVGASDIYGRVAIYRPTDKLLEFQGGEAGGLDALRQNSINAGYADADIETKYVNKTEYDRLQLRRAYLDAQAAGFEYDYSLLTSQTENLNTLYYKAISLKNNGTFGLTGEFAESAEVVLIPPDKNQIQLNKVIDSGVTFAWVCCNITRNDRLYSNGGTAELNGTLTNAFNTNYKIREPYDNGTYRNLFVGASINPNVYNRRAIDLDGTQVAWARETKNTTVPILMKIKLIG